MAIKRAKSKEKAYTLADDCGLSRGQQTKCSNLLSDLPMNYLFVKK